MPNRDHSGPGRRGRSLGRVTASTPLAGPPQLLDEALRRDPARPLLTFYDDATGERTELSVATFANWVAKTANLLPRRPRASTVGRPRGARPAAALAGRGLVAGGWASGLLVVARGDVDGVDDPRRRRRARSTLPWLAYGRTAARTAPGTWSALGLGPMGLPVAGRAVAAGRDHPGLRPRGARAR